MRLRDGTAGQKALFAALVGVSVLGVGMLLAGVTAQVGRPHSGLAGLAPLIFPKRADVEKAGVAWGSRLVALNGVEITGQSTQEILTLIRRDLGGTNTLTVRQLDGKIVQATAPVTTYTWADAAYFYALMVGLGAGLCLVGVTSFLLRPYEPPSWALLAMGCIGAAYATVALLATWDGHAVFQFCFWLTVGLVPSILLHCAFVFPTVHPLLERNPRVLYAIYTAGLPLVAFLTWAWIVPRPPAGYVPILLTLHAVALFSLVPIVYRCVQLGLRSGDRLIAQRARILLVGAGLGFGGYLILASLALVIPGWLSDWRITFLPLSIAVLALGYLTVRQDLLNARIAIRRGVAYVLAGTVAVLAIWLGGMFSPVLSAVLLVPLLFVWPRFNARVNGWLYPRRAEFPALRLTIGDELLACTTREGVLHVLAGAPPRVCDTASGAAFLMPGATDETEHISGSGESDVTALHNLSEEPLVQTLVASRETIKRESLRVDSRFAKISQEASACMDRLNASVLLPIERDGRVIGGLAVGPHVSDDVFDPAELELLRELSHQAVQALSVAELRERSDPGATEPGFPRTERVSLPTVANGRFVAQRLLGEGGYKRVYLARDATLGREVALALIRPELLDDAVRKRIQREAQAMAALGDHPHIVTVHDLGEDAGQVYIVSQYMAGGDLTERLDAAPDRRLPVAEAVRIATELCLALDATHAMGLVHRDVKPGNVWFTADNRAKLGDFGLTLGEAQSRITQEGGVVGTVAYMSPEQARGQMPEARSDLYSLGVVLYEMLSGRLPFSGEPAAILDQHRRATPSPPCRLNPDMPQDLDTLILQLLAKNPDARPASAAEVRERLAAVHV